MKTTLSSKGQVVLPSAVRRKLGLVPGAMLDVALESGRIVLAPAGERPRAARLGTDRRTGLPQLEASPRGPRLTSAQVRELLADLP
jgi:AbrB family looped-hinge helix DNA binding protein